MKSTADNGTIIYARYPTASDAMNWMFVNIESCTKTNSL